MSDRCRSCDAPIEWAITEKGRRIPLDPGVHPDGNLVIGGDGIAVYIAPDGLTPARRSHFVSCPNAARHRRRRRGGAR